MLQKKQRIQGPCRRPGSRDSASAVAIAIDSIRRFSCIDILQPISSNSENSRPHYEPQYDPDRQASETNRFNETAWPLHSLFLQYGAERPGSDPRTNSGDREARVGASRADDA